MADQKPIRIADQKRILMADQKRIVIIEKILNKISFTSELETQKIRVKLISHSVYKRILNLVLNENRKGEVLRGICPFIG